MSSQDSTQALPGFEELVAHAVDRAGAQDFTGSKYTAANVLRDYPETFRSIATAIFKYNLPNRVIRELYRVNGMTIKGIHDMVIGACSQDGARGEFLIRCRAASARSIVQSRILDALIDKLDDEDIVKEITVNELVSALKSIEPQADAREPKDRPGKTVTIVEADGTFEDMINGLIAGKTRAPALDEVHEAKSADEEATATGLERSMTNAKSVDNSI